MSDEELDRLLSEAAAEQKKKSDAKEIFASEELIAKTMQRLEEQKSEAHPQKHSAAFFRRWKMVAAVAAVFAVVLLVQGVRAGIPQIAFDAAKNEKLSGGMSESAQSAEQIREPVADGAYNQAAAPSDLYGISITLVLEEEEKGEVLESTGQQPLVTEEEGVEPFLLYEGEAVSFLTVLLQEKELHLSFDYPQDFVYSCGRAGEQYYLLVTRRLTSDEGYEHRLLFLDFGRGGTEELAVLQNEDGPVTWILWQDGSISYRCGE